MKYLLRAKHWILFLAMVGPGILANMFSLPAGPGFGFAAGWLIFMVVLLCWFYSIGIAANAKVSVELRKGTAVFTVGLIIPVIYAVLLSTLFFPKLPSDPSATFPTWALPLHLVSMLGIFYGMWFAAKQFCAVRLGRAVRFLDFAGIFFLMWFCFMGVWFIQPEVNRHLGEDA